MDSSKAAYQDKLQSIINAAQSLKIPAHIALCNAGKLPLQPDGNMDSDGLITPPFLPMPDSITSCLIDTGCSPSIACALSDAFLRAAYQINEGYQTTYRQSCKALTQQMSFQSTQLSRRLEHVRSVFERQYRDRILAAEQLAMDRAQAHRVAARAIHIKPTFNQEFVPLLEKYFEYNAYPSAPDRAALARKSMMTPRQIEVWFQNHRNRSKKEGKVLRRLTCDPLPLNISLDSLEQKMPFFVIPENQRGTDRRAKLSKLESSGDENNHVQVQNTLPAKPCLFSMDVPLHAFPVPYPSPSYNYDPFPCKKRKYSLPIPVWRRTPVTSRPVQSTVDFDDFISIFASKLIFREASSKKQCRTTTEDRPWFSSIHTTVSRAPHPALVRPPASLSLASNPVVPLSTVSASSSHCHLFRSPGPFSPITSLIPVQSDSQTRRKVAPLPKHTPNESLLQRSSSPALSAESPSSPSSRTPSLSSITSSSRRPSSSSSSSSGPSTPNCPPASISRHTSLSYVFEPQYALQIKGGDLMGSVSAVVYGADEDEPLFSNNLMATTTLEQT